MGACGLFFVESRQIAPTAEREAAVFTSASPRGNTTPSMTMQPQPSEPPSIGLIRRNSSPPYAKKMGDCKTPVGAISFFTNANTSGTSVQLRYRLECASGALDETLVYVVTGDGPRLVGYNANSPALVLR
jgi:hypothetical protein